MRSFTFGVLLAALGALLGVSVMWIRADRSVDAVDDAARPEPLLAGQAPLREQPAEDRLSALEERLGRIESLIAELALQVESLTESGPAEGRAYLTPDEAYRALAPEVRQSVDDLGQRAQALNRTLEELRQASTADLATKLQTRGGFTPDRARWIAERADELTVEAMEAEFAAAQKGETPSVTRARYVEKALRNELTEDEYERYRRANGRPTDVHIARVLASSIADRAGLRPGDRIVAYDGERVMDLNDIQDLAADGPAGTPALLEFVRDGQRMQVVVPRGPIGVSQRSAIDDIVDRLTER